MKHLFLTLILAIGSTFLFGQKIPEPEFVGESFIIKSNHTPLDLQKETVKIRTRAGISVYLTGIGKVKSKIQIRSCCSSVRTTIKKNLQIVVKAVDNLTDPLSIVQVFKFDKRKKKRLAEIASVGTFAGSSSNNLEYIRFKGAKYGHSSYILTIPSIKTGEYGIIVSNPNNRDEKNIVVSTFGVD